METASTGSTPHATFFSNSSFLLSASILYYDYFLTLGSEISCIWRRPKSSSKYWFFLNRYFAFFGNIVVTVLRFMPLKPEMILVNPFYSPSPSCQKFNLSHQLLLVVTQVLVCVLLTMRIYALYSCSFRILAFMLISAAILVVLISWSLVDQHSVSVEQVSGCYNSLSTGTGIHIAAAWEALFVYDSLVFALTLLKTYKIMKYQHSMAQTSYPITTLMLRDGAIYFAVMAISSLSNVLTFYISEPLLKGCLSTFASAMSVTMMSRLMLNLHETADAGIFTEDSTNTVHLSNMFRSHNPTTVGSESQGAHVLVANDDGYQIEMQDFDTQIHGHPRREAN